MKKKPTQKLSRVQNWSFSIASAPAFTRGRRGMKRNASGPLEVCGRDMSMFYHVFTLPSARADSLKFHGKKKHWWRWSQAKWFPQNWHGIAAAAKSQRYISRLRPRDASAIWQVKIQEIEFRRAGRACDGCWYRAMPNSRSHSLGEFLCKTAAVRALKYNLIGSKI